MAHDPLKPAPVSGKQREKVLLISVDAFPKLGGISTMTHHLANVFAELTGRSILLAPAGSHVPAGHDRRYDLIEDWESDTAAREGAAALVEDRRIEMLVARIIAEERPTRILLMHGFYYGPGAIRAARREGVPISVYVHGTELTSQMIALKRGAPQGETSLPGRLLCVLSEADEVLTNSHFTAGLVAEAVRVRRVRVTGVGLVLSRLSAERRQSPWTNQSQRRDRRRALGLPEGPLLAYIGRLTGHKRIDRMLRICAEMPETSCVIGGHGPARPELVDLAEDLGIASRCRFLGQIGETEKWALLRAANFSFLMSDFDAATGACEGFGIGLLEAAAAGALPVSSGVDGMADFMRGPERPGVVLPVAPLDPLASAALLTGLLADEAEMDAFILRGRRMISQRYNWSNVARAILSPQQSAIPVQELRHAG